ncbi:hypothetical protein PC111_g5059 [Phytophthora cactorum]|nr:hypothetical protein PC111_g5059 [Phytophthora cactorum]
MAISTRRVLSIMTSLTLCIIAKSAAKYFGVQQRYQPGHPAAPLRRGGRHEAALAFVEQFSFDEAEAGAGRRRI